MLNTYKVFWVWLLFYAKFVPNLATLAKPLYILLGKDAQWNLTNAYQQAFLNIKCELTSPRFLTHYRQDLPLKLVCDASPIGVVDILSHIFPDGSEKPIAYASRTLSKTEEKYSQIDKEALALIFGVRKFHMYLYGRHFTLVSDHKPLLALLGDKVGLPKLAALRLQRWAVFLSAYSYTLEYRSSRDVSNADALSRLPSDEEGLGKSVDKSVILMTASNIPLTSKQIAEAT